MERSEVKNLESYANTQILRSTQNDIFEGLSYYLIFSTFCILDIFFKKTLKMLKNQELPLFPRQLNLRHTKLGKKWYNSTELKEKEIIYGK